MKKSITLTLVLLLVLTLSSGVLTGCAGCGTDMNNTNDMVESTPPNTEEGILEDENASNNKHENGGNTNNTEISTSANTIVDDNTMVDDNANLTDANGNPIAADNNAGNDAGNVVGDAIDNVGYAAADVVDGVGNGVRDLTR